MTFLNINSMYNVFRNSVRKNPVRVSRMLTRRTLVLAVLSTAATVSAGWAHSVEANPVGVERQMLYQIPLPNFPDQMVTALTIEIAPGAEVGPHRHGGFVYVYLLQGTVRSQMEGEDVIEYVAGQSWIERTDALHTQTVNPSLTEPAKFLAVIYSDTNAVVTKPAGAANR